MLRSTRPRTRLLERPALMRALAAFVMFVALLAPFAAPDAEAQEVTLALSQAPYYVDVPIEIEVTAEGFEEEPQPKIEAHGPAARHLQLVGVTPNVSRSVRIVNGQISQTSSVRFVYAYRMMPPGPGRYQIGPFRVTQGNTTKVTGLTNVAVETVPLESGQKIRVKIASGDIFVGQRIPIEVQWWISPELRGTLFNQRITVPMLDQVDSFSVDSVTETDPQGRKLQSSLIISVAGTPAEYPATEQMRTEGGIEYVVRTTKMTVVPLKPGDYSLQAATVTVDQATRWRRDLFGSRVPTQARKIRAMDRSRSLRVLDVPSVGRPSGFSGAIGTGFTIDVSADRSVVQVGDPITLTIALRGDGSIESASLPNLIGPHALRPRDFRVVRAPRAGRFADGEKQFEAVIRVMSADVKEVPPIEFAWFDPEAAEFHTHSSRPIALSVRDAQVVGAGDVVRNAPDPADTSQGVTGDDAARDQQNRAASDDTPSARRPSFTLTGADLAIETDPDALVGSSANNVWQWGCYGAGVLLLVVAVFRRRRGEIDPKRTAVTKQLAADRKALASSSSAGEIADVLRRMAASGEVGDAATRSALESVLSECDALAYAPGGAAATVNAQLKERASAVAESIKEPA